MKIKKKLIRGMQWVVRIGGTSLLGSVPKLRAAAGNGAMLKIEPQGLEWSDEVADTIPCEWIIPSDALNDEVLLYFHGGGGVLGLYNSSRKIIGHVSAASKMKALMVDYRLAPEHPFPAGLEDCVAAYRWLLKQGYDSKKIVLIGDSMGGYLVISALLYLRENKLPLPAAAVGISPVTDPTCSGESVKRNAKKDALLSPKFLQTVTEMYIGDHPLEDPILAPLTADLTGLPPMLIQAGENEILLDDARRFKERSLAYDTNVTLEVWPEMWHDWHVCAPELEESIQAVERIGEYVREKINQ